MAEWSIAAVLKTVDPQGSGGSNPSLSAPQKQQKTRTNLRVFFVAAFAVFGGSSPQGNTERYRAKAGYKKGRKSRTIASLHGFVKRFFTRYSHRKDCKSPVRRINHIVRQCNFIFLTDSHLYKTCRVNIFQVPVFLYRS